MAVAIRNIDWRKVNKVAIALILAVSFLLLVCWTAPQAQAIALTTAAAITILALLVLATCGLKITAPSKQSNIDYLQPKLADYAASLGFASIDNWISNVTGHTVSILNLFSVIGGAISIGSDVANALLAYASSFIEDEGITSSGQPIGQIGESALLDVGYMTMNPNWATITVYDASNLSYFSNVNYVYSSNNVGIEFTTSTVQSNTSYPVPAILLDTSVLSGTLTINENTPSQVLYVMYSNSAPVVGQTWTPASKNSYNANNVITISISHSYKYLVLCMGGNTGFTSNTDYHFFASGDVGAPNGTILTPSDNIAVPPNIQLGEDMLLKNNGIVETMSNEDALNKVLDDTTQLGGLTADHDKDGDAVPVGSEWLYNSLEGISESLDNQNPHTDWIPNSPFNFSFSGIWHYVEDWLDSFTSGIAAVLAVWNEIPLLSGALYGALVAAVVVGVWRRFFE